VIRSLSISRNPVVVRCLARGLGGVGLSAAWLAGGGAAGAVVSMREAYPRAPQAGPAEGWPPATPVPEGRLAVAVVLGPAGRSSPMRSGPTRSSPAHQSSSCTRCRPATRPQCCRVGWPWCPTTRWKTSTRAWRPNPRWSWSRPWLPQTATRKHRCAIGSPARPTRERACWACATAPGCSRPQACLTVAAPGRHGLPGPRGGAQPYHRRRMAPRAGRHRRGGGDRLGTSIPRRPQIPPCRRVRELPGLRRRHESRPRGLRRRRLPAD
jgi:hypothetical protein